MQPSVSATFQRINGDADAAGPDFDLVAAARAGSNAAFEQLQSRHSRRLYRRIHSITRNHEDAEDALQDTFLHAYLALDSFEGRSQFATWLTRIAINSALMVLRRRRTRAEVQLEPSPESGEPALVIDVRDTALNPEELYDLRQRSYCASCAISKLSINLRTPMKTWIDQDCSMKEVARTLDLSLATVKARLYRARKQLVGSAVFQECAPNVGSMSRPKRQYAIPDIQNRELPCPSFD
jgi:RNA polymerase sigma-70 factor (ECF subfamily)